MNNEKQYLISESELDKVIYFLEHLSGFEKLLDSLKSKQPVQVLDRDKVKAELNGGDK